MKIKLFYLLGLLLLASCSHRNLAYLSDLQEQATYEEGITNDTEPKIQAYDLLSVSVTSLNPEASALFNTGQAAVAASMSNFSIASNTSANSIYREGYLVDKEGFIDFPVLGKVKLGGLTKAQAKEHFVSELEKHLKGPIVNVRYLNYKVTVVGEVNRPSTFTIPSERINILEALGMAGDMTAFGKRENVLVIREENGIRKVTRLNLNNKDVLSSPFFYLQQNDVVYVEPSEAKELQSSTRTYYLPIAVAVVSALSIVLSRLF
ncbi:sugar transporter [Pontibacter diazotrophicus]|uniref:Sugar transporter n=1 Tax=Pontibacter diazotrophicus TaxID=1400979 RepID=A0A3D8L132_9BACT|nr:polysaccharide biosynthesis/export family protein [Pontibacter diazotrophicus]RDV11101.1 sugar transporter [Pontibacter diazotrophicus]